MQDGDVVPADEPSVPDDLSDGGLSRRRLLGLAGVGAALVAVGNVTGLSGLGPITDVAGAASRRATCTLTPEATEGPYYLDDHLIRRDIREDRGGHKLRLVLGVVEATTCAPIPGTRVEIWHADRQGNYSGFATTTTNDTFLRGGQRTDANGVVRFVTNYPGWYPGRTAHIHVKVHIRGQVVHTGQLYFPQPTNDQVYAEPRYRHAGSRATNHQDDIFNSSGGEQTKLAVSRTGDGGYKGTLTMGLAT